MRAFFGPADQSLVDFYTPGQDLPRALTPLFLLVIHQAALNQSRNGILVSWKVVPVVTDISASHPAQW